jgi:hypothetical protein
VTFIAQTNVVTCSIGVPLLEQLGTNRENAEIFKLTPNECITLHAYITSTVYGDSIPMKLGND